MMNRFVVTGGAGFIGSHLVDELINRQLGRITVVDDLSRGSMCNMNPAAELSQVDLRYCELDTTNSVVFHLAAKVTGIHYNMSHHLQMMTDNLAINCGMVHTIQNYRPAAVIWVSTACVYPHNAPVPTPECAGEMCNPEPTNFGYGVAKWVGEQQAKYIYKELGIPVITVRFFNAFGPRDYYDEETSHVAPALIKRVVDGEDPLVVWGSGNQTRALVDARDIAKSLVDLYEHMDVAAGKVVNIGHEYDISIGGLAKLIATLCDKPNLKIVFDKSKPEGYSRRAADSTLLYELTGHVPDRPIANSLRDMVKEYRHNVESSC